MVIGNYKYGISYLPDNCMAYKDGYRYGAYKVNLNNKNDMHITEWFKTKDINRKADDGERRRKRRAIGCLSNC